jgi:hypothetical protein
MTGPNPLDDAALDRLLGHHEAPPPLTQGFADRVLAEAAREDRQTGVPPLPPRPRAARRPWARRSVWAGVIAINLIVASAIAATITGVSPRLSHAVAMAAQVLHIHRHAAPPPHHGSSPPPVRRSMPEVPSSARPLPFARAPMPLVRPGLRTGMLFHPLAATKPGWHPPLRAAPIGHVRRPVGRRSEMARPHPRPHPFAQRPGRQEPHRAFRPGPAFQAPDRAMPPAFDRPQWNEGPRRPWSGGWRNRGGPRMGPWRQGGQRGQGGWRRPWRGGQGAGWRRPFGRGRRF